MATVSELSMYQATAMKLEHQKREQQDELSFARQRLEEGLVRSLSAQRSLPLSQKLIPELFPAYSHRQKTRSTSGTAWSGTECDARKASWRAAARTRSRTWPVLCRA